MVRNYADIKTKVPYLSLEKCRKDFLGNKEAKYLTKVCKISVDTKQYAYEQPPTISGSIMYVGEGKPLLLSLRTAVHDARDSFYQTVNKSFYYLYLLRLPFGSVVPPDIAPDWSRILKRKNNRSSSRPNANSMHSYLSTSFLSPSGYLGGCRGLCTRREQELLSPRTRLPIGKRIWLIETDWMTAHRGCIRAAPT